MLRIIAPIGHCHPLTLVQQLMCFDLLLHALTLLKAKDENIRILQLATLKAHIGPPNASNKNIFCLI